MTRLSLSTRVEKWWPKLAGRDLDALPTGLSHQLDLLVKQMGVSRETFVSYKPSTRLKYVRAAKKGRTVGAERARVKEQRAAKVVEKRNADINARGEKLDKIMRLRERLIYEYSMDTSRGDNTQVDQIEAEVLLSRDSIIRHIAVYGADSILLKMEGMLDAVENADTGARNWQQFAASAELDTDERWFWYHSQPTIQPFGGYPGR